MARESGSDVLSFIRYTPVIESVQHRSNLQQQGRRSTEQLYRKKKIKPNQMGTYEWVPELRKAHDARLPSGAKM